MEKLLQLPIMNKNEMKRILRFKLEQTKNKISSDVIEACNVLIIQYPVDVEGFQNIYEF